MNDEQDIRKMGGLRKILPFTYISFLIGSLALMGFPFLTGFYSKDVILELAFSSCTTKGHFAYWLGIITAGCTAFYSIKSIYFVFLKKTNAYKNVIKDAHEPSFSMFFSLNILIIGSLFLGYLSKDMFIGLGTNFWGNSLYTNPINILIIDAEFLQTFIKLLAICLSFFGLFFSLYIYNFKFKYFFNIKLTNFNKCHSMKSLLLIYESI
jgi:NADH-ubiquinone oxidoreductase chain 5